MAEGLMVVVAVVVSEVVIVVWNVKSVVERVEGALGEYPANIGHRSHRRLLSTPSLQHPYDVIAVVQ